MDANSIIIDDIEQLSNSDSYNCSPEQCGSNLKHIISGKA